MDKLDKWQWVYAMLRLCELKNECAAQMANLITGEQRDELNDEDDEALGKRLQKELVWAKTEHAKLHHHKTVKIPEHKMFEEGGFGA